MLCRKEMFFILVLICMAPLAKAAPTITVTATSATLLGGSQTISLTCTLIDPNQTGVLRTGGTVITNFSTNTATPGTTATCGPIWGNDVVTDGFGNASTSYYLISVYTVSGGIIASTPSVLQAYQFAGSGTFDLSSTLPYALGPVSPAGSVLGQNLTFTGIDIATGLWTFNAGITSAGPTQLNGTTTAANPIVGSVTGSAGSATTATTATNLSGPGSITNIGKIDKNYCVIDGSTFAASAAGINNCDTVFLSGIPGEIWVPGNVTATDAQITISAGHTLRVTGNLTIANPVLLGKYSRLTCSAEDSGANAEGMLTASVNMTSMVRGTAQDGSIETWYIDNCTFNGNSKTFTRPVVDLTGANDVGRFAGLQIFSYAGTQAGIGFDQSGGVNCCGHIVLDKIWLAPNSSAPCFTALHDNSNSAIIESFDIRYLECQGSTAASPILIQNTGASGGLLRFIHIGFLEVDSAGTQAININGVNHLIVDTVLCSISPCVVIQNSSNNQGIYFKHVLDIAGGTTISDLMSSPNQTITVPEVQNYAALNTNALAQSADYFLETVNFFRLNFPEQSAPSSFAATGNDPCYGDSTAHAIKCSYNGGSFGQLPISPNPLISMTAPTITGAGCGGTLAAISAPNGTASFNIFTGTAPTSGGCTITMPAATTDWHCESNHVSAISTTNFIIQQTGALSTTSVTLQLFSDVAAATAPAASDTWRVTCTAN
jgi:hypothetical protein